MARLLFLVGLHVVVLERSRPMCVRRRVAFSEAVRCGRVLVEGVEGRLVGRPAPGRRFVEVVVDADARLLKTLRPRVLVDARMEKVRQKPAKRLARVVVGLGPGFVAGRDVHVVVETRRGTTLGAVVRRGAALADTGRPAVRDGLGSARVIRAPSPGLFRAVAEIGQVVEAGEVIGSVGGRSVVAGCSGRLRGLLPSGYRVVRDAKLGDVDPDPGVPVDVVSDRGRAVAAGVLEAIAGEFVDSGVTRR